MVWFEKLKYSGEKMDNTEKEKLILKLFKIWNQGNLDIIEDVFSTDYIGHYPHTEIVGIEGIKGMIRFIRGAFQDWHEELKDIIISGEKVVARFLCTGTHTGFFMEMAPTGNKVEFEEIAIFLIRNGKVVEQWGVFDSYRMMDQLGALKT